MGHRASSIRIHVPDSVLSQTSIEASKAMIDRLPLSVERNQRRAPPHVASDAMLCGQHPRSSWSRVYTACRIIRRKLKEERSVRCSDLEEGSIGGRKRTAQCVLCCT